jgi:hypothetical protein
MPATRLRILLHWPTRCDEMTFYLQSLWSQLRAGTRSS